MLPWIANENKLMELQWSVGRKNKLTVSMPFLASAATQTDQVISRDKPNVYLAISCNPNPNS
jgi:hypothetical protein